MKFLFRKRSLAALLDRASEFVKPGPPEPLLTKLRQGFDASYYLSQNVDVAQAGIDPFTHYMRSGWRENRRPNEWFDPQAYVAMNPQLLGVQSNPFAHFLEQPETKPAEDDADADALLLFESDDLMLGRLSRAKSLDPMVAMPNGPRTLTSPLKAQSLPTDVGVSLRKQLAGKRYRYIVAVPHVRMSGASRVASIFAEALSGIYDPSEILVVTTDSSDHEYMDWFSAEIDVFDLSKEITDLGPEHKIKALIDVMRGVNCQTIINVNSRLLWEAMRMYGRQIHHEFRVVTYLFTWDETPKGDRVGYPIQWLRDTADHHHLLLTDTKNLADDVSDRLGFGHLENGGQVVPLYTPIDQSEVTAAPSGSRRGGGHFLWAGRFDPQKRLDVLVAIAKANPNMTFDVYGKTVLSKADLASYNPPKNIHHKGTYTDLQEVLDTPYSGFLYTAQWDGLPTILLDMAAAGLPIVAPDVGGISELLDNTTGWLIDDFQDVDGYSAALAEMAKSPKEAASRAAALKLRLADGFTFEHYTNRIKEMVNTYEL